MTNRTRPALAFCILFLAFLGSAPPSSFAQGEPESLDSNPGALPYKHLFQPLLDIAPPGHFTHEHQQRLNTGMELFTRSMDDAVISALIKSTAYLLIKGFPPFPSFETTSGTLAHLYTLMVSEENAIRPLAINFACTRAVLNPTFCRLSFNQKHQLLGRLAKVFALSRNQGAYADSALVTIAPFFGPHTCETLFMSMVARTLFYLRKTGGQPWSVYPSYLNALAKKTGDPQTDARIYIMALRNHVAEYHRNNADFQPLIANAFGDSGDGSPPAFAAEEDGPARKKRKQESRTPDGRKVLERKKEETDDIT